MRRLRSHLTYANVVASLALLIALAGGTAWAANEWTGANIVDGSLTGRDVRQNSITHKDVQGLTSSDFKGGQLLAGSDNVTVVQVNATVDNNGVAADSAQCPESTVNIGGGFNASTTGGSVLASFLAGNNRWFAALTNGTVGEQFEIFAVCVA